MTANPCRTQNQVIKRGTTFLCEITVKDGDENPVDMSTGFTCRMQVRQYVADGSVIFTADSEGAEPSITLGDGLITIAVDVPDAAQIGVHVYDIILSAPDGDFAIAGGTFEIQPRVTLDA